MDDSLPGEKYQGHGLLSKLFEDCKRHNSLSDDIAFACAIQVLSAVTQRRYKIHVGSTQLYQMFVCPMGSGKEGYRRWVAAYLRNIDTKLIGPVYRSDQALKKGLVDHPSRVLLIDEIADNLSGAYDKRNPDVIQQDMITLWNELYNALPVLEGSQTVGKEIPAVERPRVGIIGFTTPGMFSRLMKMREFVETGLFSRFTIHTCDNHDYQKWDDDRVADIQPEKTLLEELRALAAGAPGISIEDEVHEVTLDKSARFLFASYAEHCRHDALHGVPEPHRGIHRRVRELYARKLAAIHALAQERRVVFKPDVEFGVLMADEQWIRTSQLMRSQDASEESREQQDLLDLIRNQWVAKGQVPIYASVIKNARAYRNMDGNKFHVLLRALVLTGEVEMVGPKKKHLQPVVAAQQELSPFEERGDAAFEGDGLTSFSQEGILQ